MTTILEGNSTDGQDNTSTEVVNPDIQNQEANQEEGKQEDVKIEGAPEKYEDFALPKDFEFKQEDADQFTEMAKKLNLDQAKAQTVLDYALQKVQGLNEKHQDAWNNVREKWVTDLKIDKEFGGTKFNETVERANRALGKYGSKELTGWLSNSGFGDNIDLVKMFARIDKATGEGGLIDGSPVGGDRPSMAETMYPGQGK